MVEEKKTRKHTISFTVVETRGQIVDWFDTDTIQRIAEAFVERKSPMGSYLRMVKSSVKVEK